MVILCKIEFKLMFICVDKSSVNYPFVLCSVLFLQCEPLYGWGFRRGGYMCMCKPGYRYPPWQYGPFLGIEIDSATEEEYQNGFNCVPVQRN